MQYFWETEKKKISLLQRSTRKTSKPHKKCRQNLRLYMYAWSQMAFSFQKVTQVFHGKIHSHDNKPYKIQKENNKNKQ